MIPAPPFTLVLVTAPDLTVARNLVRLALEAHIVACGNLVPALESHYWWQGKIETSQEVLVLFKTAETQLNALERLVLTNHPYETPEIIALPLTHGTQRYLGWLGTSLKEPAGS